MTQAMPKLAVLRGGSVATSELINALASHLTADRTLYIVLHGRDAHKLARLAQGA